MMKLAKTMVMVVALCGFGSAVAAPPQEVAGKVVAVEDGQVKIAIEGEKPAWVKKNAPLKFQEGAGKVIELSEGTPSVITVKTKQASKLKADDVVTFTKGKSMAGC